MTEENQSSETVTETTTTEEVVQTPVADEGGPLGNVTEAVTTQPTQDTVVKRTEETVTESPAED